jgi:hypothetical protein
MKFIYGLALGRVLLTLPNMNVWHDTLYFLLCWNNYLSVGAKAFTKTKQENNLR